MGILEVSLFMVEMWVKAWQQSHIHFVVLVERNVPLAAKLASREITQKGEESEDGNRRTLYFLHEILNKNVLPCALKCRRVPGFELSALQPPSSRLPPPHINLSRLLYWQAGETAFGRLSLLHTDHVSDLPFRPVFRSFLTATAAETDIFRKISHKGRGGIFAHPPSPLIGEAKMLPELLHQ